METTTQAIHFQYKLSEVSPDVAANDHIFDEENVNWARGEYHD